MKTLVKLGAAKKAKRVCCFFGESLSVSRKKFNGFYLKVVVFGICKTTTSNVLPSVLDSFLVI